MFSRILNNVKSPNLFIAIVVCLQLTIFSTAQVWAQFLPGMTAGSSESNTDAQGSDTENKNAGVTEKGSQNQLLKDEAGNIIAANEIAITKNYLSQAKQVNESSIKYLADLKKESSPPSTLTTGTDIKAWEKFREVKMKWAEVKIETSGIVLTSVTSLPSPTSPVDFFKKLEELKLKVQKKENELDLAKESKKLLSSQSGSGKSSSYEIDLILIKAKIDFVTEQAKILQNARVEMKKALRKECKTAEEEAKIRTKAYEAIAKEKAEEIDRIERRAKELAQKALEESKINAAIADQARKDMAATTDKGKKDLARLRVAYAELKTIVKTYEVRTIDAEIRVKKEEVRYQSDRSYLSAKVDELKKLSPSNPQVIKFRDEWQAKLVELDEEAQLLTKEANVLRNNVSDLRKQRDEAQAYYDDLDSRLKDNKNNKIFRQRVYYARNVDKLAAAKLDQYRMKIELIQDHKRILVRHNAPFAWAIRELQAHTKRLWFGQTSEQLLYFLLGIVLTYVLTIVLNLLINIIFRKLASKSPWHWDNVAIEELKTPIRLVLIFIGLWTSLKILTLSDLSLTVANKLRITVGLLWLGFLGWRILNVIHRILKPKFAKTETTLDDQLLNFVGKALRTVLVLITGIYLLENFGWHVSSLLAGLGIGGLAFALAAKDTLANLFGSIVLFVDRPFHIGNWVVIGNTEGIVEDIGIRSTRIRTFKDTVVTIPNANVANSPAENIHSFRKRRLYFTLTLRLDTPVDKVEQTVDEIRKILTDHPMVLDGYYVYITGIPADGIEIMVYCFVGTRDWGEWMHHGQAIYISVLKMLEKEGVGLAYKTTTVEFENKTPIQISGIDQFLKSKNDI